MERFTIKVGDCYLPSEGVLLLNPTIRAIQGLLDKLGKLEDLEEEMGCNALEMLEKVFTAVAEADELLAKKGWDSVKCFTDKKGRLKAIQKKEYSIYLNGYYDSVKDITHSLGYERIFISENKNGRQVCALKSEEAVKDLEDGK